MSAIEVQIEEQDLKSGLMKALVFTQSDACGVCQSEKIDWQSSKAKNADGEFIYIKRICRDCGAQSVLSDYKSGGHFWRKWSKREKPEPTSN